MVYGIVHNHGGWIDVTSAPDAGTTFTIYLPQAERVQIEQSQDSSTDEEPETSGTVLVIDDEESLVDLTTTFLSRSGFGSKGFTSASEALDWYREHAPEIDLVVLDMKMPRMSGVECFKALRKINPAVKVVILSGYIQDESAHQLLELGARRFFHKPLKYPELMQWISENIRD